MEENSQHWTNWAFIGWIFCASMRFFVSFEQSKHFCCHFGYQVFHSLTLMNIYFGVFNIWHDGMYAFITMRLRSHEWKTIFVTCDTDQVLHVLHLFSNPNFWNSKYPALSRYIFFRSTFFISHRVVANAIPFSNRALCICQYLRRWTIPRVKFGWFFLLSGQNFLHKLYIQHDVSSRPSGRILLNRILGGEEDKLMKIRAGQPSQSAAFAICNE